MVAGATIQGERVSLMILPACQKRWLKKSCSRNHTTIVLGSMKVCSRNHTTIILDSMICSKNHTTIVLGSIKVSSRNHTTMVQDSIICSRNHTTIVQCSAEESLKQFVVWWPFSLYIHVYLQFWIPLQDKVPISNINNFEVENGCIFHPKAMYPTVKIPGMSKWTLFHLFDKLNFDQLDFKIWMEINLYNRIVTRMHKSLSDYNYLV